MLTAFSPQPSSARCRRRRLGAERWNLRSWQAKRDLNPQPAVLETAALPVELLACKCRKSLQKRAQSDLFLFALPMRSVLPIVTAELLQFQLLRHGLLVLRRRV